jgi:hypothetical protein
VLCEGLELGRCGLRISEFEAGTARFERSRSEFGKTTLVGLRRGFLLDQKLGFKRLVCIATCARQGEAAKRKREAKGAR